MFKSIFNIEPKDITELIKTTDDGLDLQLKQGHHTALKGVFDSGTRKLNVRFNYNRSFSGQSRYPDSGSWTTTMRPDYTLSVWPHGITEKEAEKEELIVHVHFDAKYKIANLRQIINESSNQDKQETLAIIKEFNLEDFSWGEISAVLMKSGYAAKNKQNSLSLLSFFWEEEKSIGEIKGKAFEDLVEKIQQQIQSEEKLENRKGIYKNADLLKMHAYKDAIRRTSGAYVLYPGEKEMKKQGFHEIIPGLGAFPVSPSKKDDGISYLREFILEVINHFTNRASQREKIAYRTYDVYKNKPEKGDEINEALPETYGPNRSLVPDDTYVLVAYYKKENWEWILKNKLFNTRAGNVRGSLRLGPGETGAKYVLLHTKDETVTGKLFKIRETGPRIFARKTLERIHYPKDPKKKNSYYLVYKVAELSEREFKNQKWDITKLSNYKKGRGSALPFSVSLSELMRVKVDGNV